MVRQFPDERHIIIEDTREIQCAALNVVFFHTTDEVDAQKCLKQGLRFKPKRIHFGEVRDGIALDLLAAWNTGHPGGISTLHANSAKDGLERLSELVSRNPHPPRHIEKVIGKAVQCLVFIAQTPQGRRVKEILTVKGYSSKIQDYDLQAA